MKLVNMIISGFMDLLTFMVSLIGVIIILSLGIILPGFLVLMYKSEKFEKPKKRGRNND